MKGNDNVVAMDVGRVGYDDEGVFLSYGLHREDVPANPLREPRDLVQGDVMVGLDLSHGPLPHEEREVGDHRESQAVSAGGDQELVARGHGSEGVVPHLLREGPERPVGPHCRRRERPDVINSNCHVIPSLSEMPR